MENEPNLRQRQHCIVEYPILRYFRYAHLPIELQEISKDFYALAWDLAIQLPTNNTEVSAGLRKLLEAKDCFIRAALTERK
jgi:hypothetical protein